MNEWGGMSKKSQKKKKKKTSHQSACYVHVRKWQKKERRSTQKKKSRVQGNTPGQKRNLTMEEHATRMKRNLGRARDLAAFLTSPSYQVMKNGKGRFFSKTEKKTWSEGRPSIPVWWKTRCRWSEGDWTGTTTTAAQLAEWKEWNGKWRAEWVNLQFFWQREKFTQKGDGASQRIEEQGSGSAKVIEAVRRPP